MKQLIFILFLALQACTFGQNAQTTCNQDSHRIAHNHTLSEPSANYILSATELSNVCTGLSQSLQFHVRLQISEQIYQSKQIIKTISNLYAQNTRATINLFDGATRLYAYSRHKYYIYALRKILI